MSSRIRIDLAAGLFEVEGTEEFVLKIYDDMKQRSLWGNHPPIPPKVDAPEILDPPKAKARRAASKRSGPSCAERIIELREGGFFDAPKSANEVKAGLEQNGHAYASNQVGAALTSLYKRSELRRLKPGKDWIYQKP